MKVVQNVDPWDTVGVTKDGPPVRCANTGESGGPDHHEAVGGVMAVPDLTPETPGDPLTNRMKLMLIRSLAGAGEAHEERALDLIGRTLDGWSFDQMVAHSVSKYGF